MTLSAKKKLRLRWARSGRGDFQIAAIARNCQCQLEPPAQVGQEQSVSMRYDLAGNK